MVNPNRTDYEGEPLSGPGILWINSKVTDPSFSVEAFTKWYEEIHIPDIIAAKEGGVVASWRYQCLDPTRSAPFLAVYRVPDMGFLQSPEFKSIPMVHPSLPDNGPIHRYADFDARFLGHVETWASENASPGRTSLLISEAIEPASGTEDDFQNWYTKTHSVSVCKLPGWQRTSRFQLVFKKENKDESGKPKIITPKWLALHEFSDASMDASKFKERMESNDQSNKILNAAQKVDIAAFRFLRGFGAKDGRWVEVEEKKPN